MFYPDLIKTSKLRPIFALKAKYERRNVVVFLNRSTLHVKPETFFTRISIFIYSAILNMVCFISEYNYYWNCFEAKSGDFRFQRVNRMAEDNRDD